MALTKPGSIIDAWLEIAAQGIRQGAEQAVATSYDMALLIECALSSTTAHLGTEIIVMVSEETSGNGLWNPFTRFIGPVGTAFTRPLSGDEAAAQTVLSTDAPVTNNLDHPGKFLFIEDTVDVTTSEVLYQVAVSADADDTITIAYGLAYAHTAAGSALWDIDSATSEAVAQWMVQLPASANRVRVIYNNNYDAAAATVITRCRLMNTTGL